MPYKVDVKSVVWYHIKAFEPTTTMLRSLTTRSTTTLRVAHARPFSVSTVRRVEGYPGNKSTNSDVKTDMLPDDEHSVNKAKKGDKNDVQTSNLSAGLE